METKHVRPADLLAATDVALGVLRPSTDHDWSVRAGSLEWDVAFTVTHIAASMTKSVAYLSAQATSWSPLVISADPRATNDQLVDGVEIGARALAFAATHADGSARGFHAWGMGDASAFLARAAAEVLIHTWDIAEGLGLAFEPPAAVCLPIVRRRFPWAAGHPDPWHTLLVAEGRSGEPGWIPVEVPLEEWDGVPPVKSAMPPAIAWVWDAVAARWMPTYP